MKISDKKNFTLKIYALREGGQINGVFILCVITSIYDVHNSNQVVHSHYIQTI